VARAAPVQRAILAGDDITGASTFLIDEGLDTGPLFGVTTEPIRPDDTAGSLLGRLAHSGAELLLATLDGIEAGTVQPVPQSTEGVTMAAKLTVQDARIDFSVPAAAIDRRVGPAPRRRERGARSVRRG
jgi:methionyl-tRNA formyltransferase